MNKFEVVLLGTGGGYGESVVMRLCDDNWIVVDSCVNPQTNAPLPLEYLISRKVDVANDVKLIICSHWHDDHIKGMDRLLDLCKSAKLSFALTSDRNKFLKFIELDFRIDKSDTTSTKVLCSCLNVLERRQGGVKHAVQDKLLWSEPNFHAMLYSLSPSEEVLKNFGSELSSLFEQSIKSNIKINTMNANNKSVVLLASVNDYSIILGADLENKEYKGWQVILNDSEALKNRCISLVKIPHHGSETAYEEKLWSERCDANVIGLMTTFNHGSVLIPNKEMLQKYQTKTNKLYITSYQLDNKRKKRSKSINKAIERLNPTIKEINYYYGVIECSINVDLRGEKWETTLSGNAFSIDKEFIEQL